MYNDKLDDIVHKYNNIHIYHRTIKIKPVDVKLSIYMLNKKMLIKKMIRKEFTVGDNVRISKYKNIFATGYVPNWSGEVFVIKKVKSTALCMLLAILKEKKLLKHFIKKNCKQVQCSNGPPVLSLTSQTSQKSKILQTDWPRVF